jgi:UrcA family protein
MMTTTSPLRALAATVIVGFLASSHSAVSQAADTETRSTVVKYGDLNLSNPQGAAALYRRISSAAQEVCNYFGADRDFSGVRAAVDACVHKAIMDAVTQVGHPELIAVYNAKNRDPLPITLAAARAR